MIQRSSLTISERKMWLGPHLEQPEGTALGHKNSPCGPGAGRRALSLVQNGINLGQMDTLYRLMYTCGAQSMPSCRPKRPEAGPKRPEAGRGSLLRRLGRPIASSLESSEATGKAYYARPLALG